MKLLSILTFVCASLTIHFDYFDRPFVYFYKPLTLVLIIASGWFYGRAKGFYKNAVLGD